MRSRRFVDTDLKWLKEVPSVRKNPKKRPLTVSIPLVANPNAKQRAQLKKAYAIMDREFARPEKQALIRELARCIARAAVDRMLEEEKTEAAVSRPVKAKSVSSRNPSQSAQKRTRR